LFENVKSSPDEASIITKGGWTGILYEATASNAPDKYFVELAVIAILT